MFFGRGGVKSVYWGEASARQFLGYGSLVLRILADSDSEPGRLFTILELNREIVLLCVLYRMVVLL